MKTHNYIGASLLAAYGLYKANEAEKNRLEASQQASSMMNLPLTGPDGSILARTRDTWQRTAETAEQTRNINLGLVGIAALIAIMTNTGSIK